MSLALPFTAVATAEKFALTSLAFAGVPGVKVLGTVTVPPMTLEKKPMLSAVSAMSEVRMGAVPQFEVTVNGGVRPRVLSATGLARGYPVSVLVLGNEVHVNEGEFGLGPSSWLLKEVVTATPLPNDQKFVPSETPSGMTVIGG